MHEDSAELIERFRSFFPNKKKRDLISIYKNLIVEGSKTFTSSQQFRIAIERFKNYDGTFSEEDFTEVFNIMQKSDKIRCEDFIRSVRGSLSTYRGLVVEFVFKKIEKNDTGFVKEGDLVSFFKESVHPDILMKRVTARAKAAEMLEKIGKATLIERVERFNKFSLEQLADYYMVRVKCISLTVSVKR